MEKEIERPNDGGCFVEVDEFRKDFLDGVKAAAMATGEGSSACFAEDMSSYLIDNELLADYTPCYYTGEYKRKKFRIDGYYFDEFDLTINIIIADYDGIDLDRTLTKTIANKNFSRALVLLDAVFNSDLSEDPSINAYDLIEILRNNKEKFRKIKLFLFTDANISSRIKNIGIEPFEDIPVECQIWDIARIFEVCTTPDSETIEINFDDFGISGVPCLRANVGEENQYSSYLGVIPGAVLADLYDKFGARLLESNVRSFLSTKVAVNKKIRETIINEPEMFFAYNNGISVTAKNVIIKTKNGQTLLTSARDFQIINGGQTTASLYNARKVNHADLSSIYVQMKLTEIDESQVSSDEAETLIRNISRSSNSQNKVSDADFFASHPFHKQMEQLSRITYAPAKNGAQYETIWFYERARGQYLQEQMRLTPAKRKAFLLKNPKDQLIKKTDLAKVQNAWLGHPDIVSKGAQTNFVKFASFIDEQWQLDDSQFNSQYYESTVALMIMFQFLQKYVSKQSWYQGGYRANIIVYSIALFHRQILRQFPGRDLDLIMIWKMQELPDSVKAALGSISKEVFDKITDEKRPVMNVTQWCKRSQCWDSVQTMNLPFNDNIEECLISTKDSAHAKKLANKDQKIIKGINAQTEVVKSPAEHWKRLSEFVVTHNIATPSDISALKIAEQIPNKIPNSVQSRKLLDLESRARQEGFKSEDN